jgi:hypothetical protein
VISAQHAALRRRLSTIASGMVTTGDAPCPPVARGRTSVRHRGATGLLASVKKSLPDQPAHSLTTAASMWVTAALGVLATWKLLIVAVAGVLSLAGGSIEKWCQIGEKADPPDSR